MLYIKGLNESTWTKLPSPTDISESYFDISTAERAEDGTMYINFIAEKKRIDISWTMLTNDQWQSILNKIRSVRPKFYIRIFRTDTDYLELMVYAGDRKAKMGFKRNGVRYWTDVSISFIEV